MKLVCSITLYLYQVKKIYVGHSSSFNFRKELYDPLIRSSFYDKYKFILPYGHRDKPIDTKDVIKNCDCMIAEVSFPSTGLGIEIGWANVFERPMLCIHREGMKVSSSLKYVTDNIAQYKDSEDLIKKIDSYLSELFSQ